MTSLFATQKFRTAVARATSLQGEAFTVAFLAAPPLRRRGIVTVEPVRCLATPEILAVLEPRDLATAAAAAPHAAIQYASAALTRLVLRKAASAAPDAALRHADAVFPHVTREAQMTICLQLPALALECARHFLNADEIMTLEREIRNPRPPPPAPAPPRRGGGGGVNVDAIVFGAALRRGDVDALDLLLSHYHANSCSAARTARRMPFPCSHRCMYNWLQLPALRMSVAPGARGRAHDISTAMRKGDLGPLKALIAESDGRTSTIASIAGVAHGTAYQWLVRAGFIDPAARPSKPEPPAVPSVDVVDD